MGRSNVALEMIHFRNLFLERRSVVTLNISAVSVNKGLVSWLPVTKG